MNQFIHILLQMNKKFKLIKEYIIFKNLYIRVLWSTKKNSLCLNSSIPKKSNDSLKIWQNWVSSCTGNCDGIPPASGSNHRHEKYSKYEVSSSVILLRINQTIFRNSVKLVVMRFLKRSTFYLKKDTIQN